MSRPFFLFSIILIIISPALTAQRSAWDLLLSENPNAADDPSIGWQDRLILHALTPHQAKLYFSGQVAADELILPDGRSLAFYLEGKLNPKAHVYIPLISPCPLFELKGPAADGERLFSLEEDLSQQGGSSSGCSIAEAAAALLIQVQVGSLSNFPSRVKLWSPEGPEPAGMPSGQAHDFPMSYETTLVVPVCRGDSCIPGEFELKVSEAAEVSGRVLGYFRPLAGSDQTGDTISFFTEGSSNNFFGTGAGANTTGSGNSFFGGEAGHENTSGSANSFFGGSSGSNNTIGNANSFFGSFAGSSNTTGDNNSFFGQAAGFSNISGTGNSFFGDSAGSANTTASSNSFFGADAGKSTVSAGANSFFGADAGESNTFGAQNTFVGGASGFFNLSGNFNTFLGLSSGLSNTTEDNNTFLGFRSNGAADISNATAIGSRAQVSQSDSLVLGSVEGLNFAAASVKVGIGTAMPAAPLHVQRTDGTVQIIRAQSTGPEAVRNMMDLINNGIPQFRLVDTSADGNNWQFSNTNSGLNISLQGSGSQEFLIEDDGDVRINNGTVLVTSGRETKKDFEPVDPGEILMLLAGMDVSKWSYKKDPETVRHIGPVSEDFYRLFGVGDGDQHITPTDLSGVALAAVQGLLERISELNRRIVELERKTTETRRHGEKSVHSVGKKE